MWRIPVGKVLQKHAHQITPKSDNVLDTIAVYQSHRRVFDGRKFSLSGFWTGHHQTSPVFFGARDKGKSG